MGADLYIMSLYKGNHENWEKIMYALAESRDLVWNSYGMQMYNINDRDKVLAKLTEARTQVTGSQEKAYRTVEKKVDKIIDRLYTFTKPIHFSKKRVESIRNAIQPVVRFAYDKSYSVGYFRESYNSAAVLNRMGLSWLNDFAELLDKNQMLTPEKAKEFIKVLKEREFIPINTFIKENNLRIDDKENSPEQWEKYHIRRKKELIKFLQTAVDLEEPVECSI
jgi:hypothetical protein